MDARQVIDCRWPAGGHEIDEPARRGGWDVVIPYSNHPLIIALQQAGLVHTGNDLAPIPFRESGRSHEILLSPGNLRFEEQSPRDPRRPGCEEIPRTATLGVPVWTSFNGDVQARRMDPCMARQIQPRNAFLLAEPPSGVTHERHDDQRDSAWVVIALQSTDRGADAFGRCPGFVRDQEQLVRRPYKQVRGGHFRPVALTPRAFVHVDDGHAREPF